MSKDLIKIESLDNFVNLISKDSGHSVFSKYEVCKQPSGGEIYCPKCGGYRNTFIYILFKKYSSGSLSLNSINYAVEIKDQLTPSLFQLFCVHCNTEFTSFIFNGPNGADMVIIPSINGGISSPNTPSGVAYYLDQAQRSKSIGANSAAVAMFRGALEHLLFEQGYSEGMLNSKIDKLVKDIENGKAPKWAINLDTEILKIIKDLGNGSIHPNNGNIKKQMFLDNELLNSLNELFLFLLYLVYDSDIEKKNRFEMFKAKVNILNK